MNFDARRAAPDVAGSVVITAPLGQEHPAARDAGPRRLAAPLAARGPPPIVSWYLEPAFGLKESRSLVVVIKTVLLPPSSQMSVAFLPLQPILPQTFDIYGS